MKEKEYQKIYHKSWYEKNKESRKRQIHERRKKNLEWLREYKSMCVCVECLESHPATLDFHHIDKNNKVDEVVHGARDGWSMKKIKEEMNKCIILCSNCHRKLHWNEKQIG